MHFIMLVASAQTVVCLKEKPTLDKGCECKESFILQDFE